MVSGECIKEPSSTWEIPQRTWPASQPMSWLGKSFDTFAPLGPCIVTADEIANPHDLLVRFWNDGQLRHNYNTDDMQHLDARDYLALAAATAMLFYSAEDRSVRYSLAFAGACAVGSIYDLTA